MRCNLECSYCHFRVDQHAKEYSWTGYGKDHEVKKEVPTEDMIAFLNTQDAPYLEFTGGEPTLYKGFREIIANLDIKARWSITSNTLISPAGIDFSKCGFWTASYHEGGDREKFKENVKWLRDKMGRVAISLVVPFDAVDKTLTRAISMRKEFGVRINLLRELNPGVSWTGTNEWEAVLSMNGNGYNVVVDDIPESYTFSNGWVCHGGEDYICVMPDGNVYRCYSDAMDGDPIGTIWNFKPKAEVFDCHRDCYGCALDHKAHITKLIGG